MAFVPTYPYISEPGGSESYICIYMYVYTSELRPWRFQSASETLQALMMVNSGAKPSISLSDLGRMNMLVTKCCCQAISVTKRTCLWVGGWGAGSVALLHC